VQAKGERHKRRQQDAVATPAGLRLCRESWANAPRQIIHDAPADKKARWGQGFTPSEEKAKPERSGGIALPRADTAFGRNDGMNEHVMKSETMTHQDEVLVCHRFLRNGVRGNAVVTTSAHTIAHAEPPSVSEGSTQITLGIGGY